MRKNKKSLLHGEGITINTDASFHPQAKVGGYAFWISSDIFRIKKSGSFKLHPINAQEAEIMCIGNVICTLLAQDNLPDIKWILVNTDCIRGWETIISGRTELGSKVRGYWNELIKKTKVSVHMMRHVKAHSGKRDNRSYVNDWCDKKAKKWMRSCLAEGYLQKK